MSVDHAYKMLKYDESTAKQAPYVAPVAPAAEGKPAPVVPIQTPPQQELANPAPPAAGTQAPGAQNAPPAATPGEETLEQMEARLAQGFAAGELA